MLGYLLTALAVVVPVDEIRLIGRPDTAIQVAATDIQTLLETDPELAQNAWYVWLRDPLDADLIGAYDYILNNAVNRSSVLRRTTKINGGSAGVLLRLDLRDWLPTIEQRQNFASIVNNYVDPCFYVDVKLSTELAGDFKGQKIFDQTATHVLIACEPYKEEGKIFKYKWVAKEEVSRTIPVRDPIVQEKDVAGNPVKLDVNKIKFDKSNVDFSPTLRAMAGDACELLQVTTGLAVPIVDGERWLTLSLRQLEGGLYYRLKGYDDGKGKRLNQTEWLALFGADEEQSKRLNGEEFVGLQRSNVTGRPRRTKSIYGTSVRPSVGPPLIVVTQDPASADRDTIQNPIKSLFEFEFKATEVLAVEPTGMIAYALFSADGVLQDSVPPDIASDHTIPAPHVKIVEPAISCIRCHGPNDQWQPMPNQVKLMLSEPFYKNLKMNVLTDFSDKDVSIDEVQARLESLYSGDLTLALKLSRNSYQFACDAITDLQPEEEGDSHSVMLVKILSDRFRQYVYDPVTPVEALRTLGVVTTPKSAHQVLSEVLPPVVDGDAAPLIDSTLVTLFLHEKDETMIVNRSDWEAYYQTALATAINHGKLVFEEVGPAINAGDAQPAAN